MAESKYKRTLVAMLDGDHLVDSDYRNLIGLVGKIIADNISEEEPLVKKAEPIEKPKIIRKKKISGPYMLRGYEHTNLDSVLEVINPFRGVDPINRHDLSRYIQSGGNLDKLMDETLAKQEESKIAPPTVIVRKPLLDSRGGDLRVTHDVGISS